VLRGDTILFAGKHYIYKTVFNQITVGTTIAETVKVSRLKNTSNQSALHHNLIGNLGNGLVWIGHDNVLYQLLDATLAYNPDLKPLSDPIKPDFDRADFTGGHLFFDKNRLYISAPASAVDFIYEYRLNQSLEKEWFWQPPQTLPVNRWTVIDGEIHGHSSLTNNTYQLFSGYNDNDGPIEAVAVLARWSGGVQADLKNLNEIFNEGNITVNTVIDVNYFFELDGGEVVSYDKQIDGSDDDITYDDEQDPSLGLNPLGDTSLSGDITDEDVISGFRVIHELNETEFFEYQVMFSTNDVDKRWEIITHGSNATLSTGLPTAIKT